MFQAHRSMSVVFITGLFLFNCSSGMGFNIDKALNNKTKIEAKGDWYEAVVPDTLDLAKRAEYSVNVLTRNVDPNNFYRVDQSLMFTPKKVGDRMVVKPMAPTWAITGKNLRALPWMRTMCGSRQNLDVEYNMMQAMLRQIHKDGQVYFPTGVDVGVPAGTSNPLVSALLVLAMSNWYERDGNQAWLGLIDHVSDGMKRVAIKVENRAYYPLECGYRDDGTWHYEQREGEQVLAYTPPDEPIADQQGVEGAVKVKHVRQILALVKDYQYSGDSNSFEMAAEIARFCLKPGMWPDLSKQGCVSYEHGIYDGHFHANVHTSYMLFGFAVANNNEWLKEFLRESYDHGLRLGVVRMGFFPSWTLPQSDVGPNWVKLRKPELHNNRTEGCGVADMLALAVKLTDAGLGDYWDDVDCIVRNQLAEQQVINMDLMRKCGGDDPNNDALFSRFRGGFHSAHVTVNQPGVVGCCSANGAIGLYYAWHGITRFDDGVATVNLFLNRASDWMDVDSYLPYEGKVVLHNKKAHTALVRIPHWVDMSKIKSFIGKKTVNAARSGSYLVFQGLKKGDKIRLEFPVPEYKDKYTIAGTEYTVSFRGSTVVDISPREKGCYPIYLRDSMKAEKAPMRTVKRFVADKVLPLQ